MDSFVTVLFQNIQERTKALVLVFVFVFVLVDEQAISAISVLNELLKAEQNSNRTGKERILRCVFIKVCFQKYWLN